LSLSLINGIFTFPLDLRRDAEDWLLHEILYLGHDCSVTEWTYKNENAPESAAGLGSLDLPQLPSESVACGIVDWLLNTS